MADWRAEFRERFPTVSLLDSEKPRETACMRIPIRAKLAPLLLMPDSVSVLPEVMRWLNNNGKRWSWAWLCGISHQCEVYVSLAGTISTEPRINVNSNLVATHLSITLGELERTLAAQGLTLGLMGSPAVSVRLQEALSGDAFVDPYLAGLGVFDRIRAVKGFLADGLPFSTKTVPRSATGPEFRRLVVGNPSSAAIPVEVTLLAGLFDHARPNLWRWLRTSSLNEALQLMQRLAQGMYPQLAMRTIQLESGTFEVRLGYARNHPLNAPMVQVWEDSADITQQSGPMECAGDELVPQVPPAGSAWYYFEVVYSQVSKLLDELESLARSKRFEFAFELVKPRHSTVLIRIVFEPKLAERKADTVVEQLSAGKGIRLVYPPLPVLHTGEESLEQWQERLNL